MLVLMRFSLEQQQVMEEALYVQLLESNYH